MLNLLEKDEKVMRGAPERGVTFTFNWNSLKNPLKVVPPIEQNKMKIYTCYFRMERLALFSANWTFGTMDRPVAQNLKVKYQFDFTDVSRTVYGTLLYRYTI